MEVLFDYHAICAELVKETEYIYGLDTFHQRKPGQHYYNGMFQPVKNMLNEKLVLFNETVRTYKIKQLTALRRKLPGDVANYIQTFLYPAGRVIL
jgi:hypothetical protein